MTETAVRLGARQPTRTQRRPAGATVASWNPGRPLNILYVGTLPPHPGGSAISAAELLVGFGRRGHRIRALAPITPEVLERGDTFTREHPAIEVTRFPVPLFHVAAHVPPVAYRRAERRGVATRLAEAVAREAPDLLFVGRESVALHLPGPALRVPQVIRAAGAATIGALGGAWPAGAAQRLLAALRRAACVVSPARHLAARLAGAGLSTVQVIPNAIDVDRFSPRPPDPALRRALGIEPTDVVVAHVSNLKSLKRALDIGRSAPEAVRRDPRLLYLVLGDGPERGALEALCRQNGTAGRFRFPGWIDYARMPDYLALADLVVIPSEDDTLPRAYLEAQATGRVLLASDIAAAREVITDGETGLLFRRGDVRDLTAQTVRVAADPGLRERIGRRAREWAAARHIEAALDAYLELFGRVVRAAGDLSRRGPDPRAGR